MRAFLRIRGDKASFKQRIFNVILATGDVGLTSKEAELRTKIPHENASARANELLRDGFLVRTGEERLNPSGQPAEILIVPKSVRNGEQAVPPAVEPKLKFTVYCKDPAYILLGELEIAIFSHWNMDKDGSPSSTAHRIAKRLNDHFGLCGVGAKIPAKPG